MNDLCGSLHSLRLNSLTLIKMRGYLRKRRCKRAKEKSPLAFPLKRIGFPVCTP
jgi:hypothetical protein